MINRQVLLSDLQKLLKSLEADLLERSNSAEVPEVGQTLRDDYEAARNAQRTAQNYEDWRSDYITQVAAAWVLSCVFVRFLEDNQLVDPPKIAGPGDRLQRARDEHELFFAKHPKLTDREYLLSVFDELAKLPGTKDVFGKHNPVRELPNWLSGDAAGELLRFFQKIDANTGHLIHDFTDPAWGTRFLGDLYQDLSEAARKKYALLQTPEFVEEFILERTLEPALDEFGLDAPAVKNPGRDDTPPGFRMIDPACGSGHFLLGAFHRILNHWQKKAPGEKPVELVLRTLQSIHGVDLNPYAVAIARFRLIVAAMQAAGTRQLAGANFPVNIACGDSLLHGVDTRVQKTLVEVEDEQPQHAYWVEDLPLLRKMLIPRHYHAVVANPPYITPKDRAANEEYRRRYDRVCHMKYSLAVPFFQRLFDLATTGGYVGQITANSFMKREFGKKLIEQYLPTIDLTHVIDTSGAYIPGHGTPTVILFGRQQKPVAGTLRTVMGIRGEPSTPTDPAHGLVWSAIVEQIDQPGSQSEFVSVGDSARDAFHKHPWSIGGGGAAELKEQLEQHCNSVLGNIAETAIGIVTLEDDAYASSPESWLRRGVCRSELIGFVEGDRVRDWSIENTVIALFPHDRIDRAPRLSENAKRRLWPLKTNMANRLWFGKTQVKRGLAWYEYGMVSGPVISSPTVITYAEVATHNHFVLDRGGKVFKQTAPVIKLPPDATEDDHLALLGLLNSSTACFWMKQVCHQKQMMGGDGIRIESKAKVPYAFNATALGRMPVPAKWTEGPLREQLIAATRAMDRNVAEYAALAPATLFARSDTAPAMRVRWNEIKERRLRLRAQQIVLQEEIDFIVYCMFDLTAEALLHSGELEDVVVTEGERPFCILAGANEDGFTVPESVPVGWPSGLKNLWKKRMAAIQASSALRLIETSMYKRRWIGRQGLFNHDRTDDELGDAARRWLLERLESYFDFDGRMNADGEATARHELALISLSQLANTARGDDAFMRVGELLRDDPAFDVERLVEELVEAESVPLLPVLRYKESGLRKRAEWEATWDMQRREDQGETVGTITVPPKYDGKDFLKSDYNRLRGKLDVPKERWVSFPHCEGPDGTLMIAWAGYDHLQLARAISAYFVDIQERLGGRDDPRLVPLLACIIELLSWLKQWHHDLDPDYNQRMDEVFEGFVTEEAKNLRLTIDQIKAWQPPQRAGSRGKRRAKA